MHGHGELDYYDSIGIFTFVHLSQLLGLFVVICHEVNTPRTRWSHTATAKGRRKMLHLVFLSFGTHYVLAPDLERYRQQ